MWAARQGGVYVPASKYTPPNPLLADIKNRDIYKPDGQKLTLVNPSYIGRQVNELLEKTSDLRVHLTSLNVIRKENAPDEWETIALNEISKGKKEYFDTSTIGGKQYFRLMRPHYIQKECLKCHSKQGYSEGDLRGGTSISIPTASIEAGLAKHSDLLGHIVIWIIGVLGIYIGRRHLIKLSLERAKHKNELLQSEQRFRLFAEMTYNWEEWINPDGSYKYISPSCKRITGFEPKDFMDNTNLFLSIIHPSDMPILEEHKAICKQQRDMNTCCIEPLSAEFRIVTQNGETKWINHVCRPVFDDQGNWLGQRVSNRDITEQQKLYRQLIQTQKFESLSVMASSIAHKFNNRLTIIVGTLGRAMRNLSEDSPIMDDLRSAKKAVWEISEISTNMLTFVGRTSTNIDQIDLGNLLEEMRGMISSSIPKTITIQEAKGHGTVVIKVDKVRLKQVLMNLIDNAVEAIDKEAGVISFSIGSVYCDESSFQTPFDTDGLRSGQYGFIEVSDTGCGMSEETASRVFEPFYTTHFSGRGLGMATVLGIVRAHRGFITINTKKEKGTTVRVLFPAAETS